MSQSETGFRKDRLTPLNAHTDAGPEQKPPQPAPTVPPPSGRAPSRPAPAPSPPILSARKGGRALQSPNCAATSARISLAALQTASPPRNTPIFPPQRRVGGRQIGAEPSAACYKRGTHDSLPSARSTEYMPESVLRPATAVSISRYTQWDGNGTGLSGLAKILDDALIEPTGGGVRLDVLQLGPPPMTTWLPVPKEQNARGGQAAQILGDLSRYMQLPPPSRPAPTLTSVLHAARARARRSSLMANNKVAAAPLALQLIDDR